MARFSKRSLDAMVGVHPNLVKVMMEAIKDTPIDFTVIEGVRTTKRQQDLYAQGRTKPGAIVTKADGVKNKSNHQAKADGKGWAIDFCPFIGGKLDWNNTKAFKAIGEHIKQTAKHMGIPVSWGGDWRFLDLPHVELK